MNFSNIKKISPEYLGNGVTRNLKYLNVNLFIHESLENKVNISETA